MNSPRKIHVYLFPEEKAMKRQMNVAIFVLLLVSVLAFYVFAQSQTEATRGMGQGAGPFVVGNGVMPPGATVLLQAVIRVDGTVDRFKIIRDPSDISTVQGGKLHIAMMDGSIQEIDLKKVKSIGIWP
jgi:hypothetical protein